MKFSVMVAVLILAAAPGCSSFLGKQGRQQRKVADAKQQIASNRELQLREATKDVYATGLALAGITNPSAPSEVAKDFNEMAQLVLGPPDVKDAVKIHDMVDGLMSPDEKVRAAAEKQRLAMTRTIVDLQDANGDLRGRLAEVEKQRDEGYAKAAAEAAKYQKWKRRIYWALGIAGGGFLLMLILPALSLAFPPLAPFAGIVSSLGATVARSIFRIVPNAMGKAQVVGQQAYTLSENTLRDLVLAIQQVKTAKPSIFDAHLRSVLKDCTDKETTRQKIDEVKAALLKVTSA